MGLRIGVDGRYLRDDHPGIGRHLFHVLRGLLAGAADDELIVLHDPRAARTRLDPLALTGARLRLVEAPWRPRSMAEQIELPRLLRRLRLDLFHAPYPFTALGCPCPRVVSVYDLIALDPRHGLRTPLRRALARLALRRVTRHAAAVVTLSQAVRTALVERFGLPAARVAVVGAAADPVMRPASPEAVAAARRALDLPPRYVLHLGTSKPHKNRARLLRAWSALRPGGVTLILAGDTPPGARGAALPASVRALGPVAEAYLPALYSAAELCVLPSLDEGFGLPVLEAMACGTAVACAARAALSEVAGDAAAYFDPEDERELGATLARLLADAHARRDLSQRGLARARSFTWEAVAARTWALYRSVARSRLHGLAGGAVAAAGDLG